MVKDYDAAAMIGGKPPGTAANGFSSGMAGAGMHNELAANTAERPRPGDSAQPGQPSANPLLQKLLPKAGQARGVIATRKDRQYSAPTVPSNQRAAGASAQAAGSAGLPCSVVVPSGAHNPLFGDQSDGEAEAVDPALAAQSAAAGIAHLSAPSTPGAATLGPVFSQRRRRSSWAAGEWPVAPSVSSDGPVAGLEALSPVDLYRQFVAIRDAVLRKAAAGAVATGAGPDGGAAADEPASAAQGTVPEQRRSEDGRAAQPPSSERFSQIEAAGVSGVCGRCGLADGGFRQSMRRRASDATSTTSVHSPHRLSNATFADSTDPSVAAAIYSPQTSPVGAQRFLPQQRASPQQPTSPQQRASSPPQTLPCQLPCLAVPVALPQQQQQQQQQQLQSGASPPPGSPVIIDLQHFYRSPTPSTGGKEGQAVSPFQGAVSYATDCVAYNALYAGAAQKAMGTLVPPAASGTADGASTNAETVRVNGTGESGKDAYVQPLGCGGSIPGTDSLFSLQPSFLYATNEASLQQQQQPRELQAACGGSEGGGAAAKMIVWQEDMSPDGEGGAEECKECSVGEVRLSDQGSGVVVHAHDTARGGPRVGDDYERALQSAAARQLLIPLPSLPSGNGASSADAAPRDSAAAAGSASVAISGVVAATQRVETPAEPTASSPFTSYVPLPLPGMPPPCAQAGGPGSPSAGGGGRGAAAVPAAPALPSSPSMVAAAAETVRKCLDKGIPFAAMTAERFAAVVAAAEAHDNPLALHTLVSHCAYYPGAGRHAASAGGIAPDASSGGSGASSPINGSNASSGGGGLLGRRPATAAAAAAAASVRRMLEEGEPLHVMSPCEYQRIVLAAQYGVRQLHDMLVAQPSPAAAAAADAGGAVPLASESGDVTTPRAAAAAAAGPRLPLQMMPPAGSMGRRHRRGVSIGSEGSFTATVVRFQSGTNATAADPAAVAPVPKPAGVRSVPAASAPAIQITAPTLTAAGRLRALVQAAQHGNAARVAYLVARGADVNATEGAVQQQLLKTQPLPEPELPSTCVAFAASGSGPNSGGLGGAHGTGGMGGRTALHYAAEAGSFAVVQLLLHYGAFVGVRDGTGRTAYDLARRKGHDAVAQLLKDAADRRRDVVRSCTAESRGTGTGGAVAGARPALAIPGLALPGLASLVSPRPHSKDLTGAGGGVLVGAGAGAAKEAASPAATVPAAGETALSPREAAQATEAGNAAAQASVPSCSAEARASPSAALSPHSAGSDASASAPRAQLSRFSKEATAAIAAAAAVNAAAVNAAQPAAHVVTAVAAVPKQSEICAIDGEVNGLPGAKAGKAPLSADEPLVVAEEAPRSSGKQRAKKSGLLACFVCGA